MPSCLTVYKNPPIQCSHLATPCPASSPLTAPPITSTFMPYSSSSILNVNLCSPPPPSTLVSSSASQLSPTSTSPLLLDCLTLSTSASKRSLTAPGGSAVKRSCLFAAIKTEMSALALVLPLPVFLRWSWRRTSCRYAAASLSRAFSPLPRDAASTT